MCGLTGIFDTRRLLGADRLLPLVHEMAARLVHRGPDDDGSWQDPESGIALGFRRLAIIDTSPAGHQPMESESGRFVIVFNGEIYNFSELRSEIEVDASTKPAWRGHSDTEVLLALIEHHGLAATLPRLDGMFAIALWDRTERRLTLARDRFGEKPLYYGSIGGIFAFASELGAFAALPERPRTLDPVGLTLFLRHGWIPSPHSIFRDVRKLAPGHYVTLDADTPDPRPQAYWQTCEEAASLFGRYTGSETDARDELERLLRLSIHRRLVADVPLGAFLSGGIDSSTVVALMAAMGANPKTFTISFPDSPKDEAPFAAAVAAHVGADHTAIPMTEGDYLAQVPHLAEVYDEPFADTSQIPTMLLCRIARRHVTVSLSGDGGDELFGGYSRYPGATSRWQRAARLPRAVSSLARFGTGCLAGNEVPPLRRLRRKLRDLAADSPEILYRNALSWWHDDDGLTGKILDDGDIWSERARPLAAMGSLPAQFMALDMSLYLPDDLETKMDRAAMASSLEVRAPLLDHSLVRFAWSLPLDMKLHGGRGKHLLREVLYRHVPPSIIDRPKQGFDPPLREWLRGPLSEWAGDLIGSNILDGLMDPRPVRRRWEEHQRGDRNWSFQIWIVLMLLSWHERWLAPGR